MLSIIKSNTTAIEKLEGRLAELRKVHDQARAAFAEERKLIEATEELLFQGSIDGADLAPLEEKRGEHERRAASHRTVMNKADLEIAETDRNLEALRTEKERSKSASLLEKRADEVEKAFATLRKALGPAATALDASSFQSVQNSTHLPSILFSNFDLFRRTMDGDTVKNWVASLRSYADRIRSGELPYDLGHTTAQQKEELASAERRGLRIRN